MFIIASGYIQSANQKIGRKNFCSYLLSSAGSMDQRDHKTPLDVIDRPDRRAYISAIRSGLVGSGVKVFLVPCWSSVQGQR